MRYEDEAKTEVADRVATVNGYEIFIVLAVFCKGEVDDQLSFVFELFDTDKSKEMDQVDCVPCPYCRLQHTCADEPAGMGCPAG